MSGTRTYDMTRRGQAAALSRRRAVEAAYELLGRAETTELSLEAVAARVGVTRATLYNQFGARAALLVAVFAEVGRRAGSERIHRAMQLADPYNAVLTTVRLSTRGIAREQYVVRKLFALRAFDAELSDEIAKAEGARRASLAPLAQRLAAGGHVSVSAREAAALLAGLTSFQAFEALSVDARPKAVERRLVGILQNSLGLIRKGKGT